VNFFSLPRFVAIALKEFIQMRRDRLTFGMMVGVPLMQLVLFGFAINTDPKQMRTALRCSDEGPFARSVVRAMTASGYFQFTGRLPDDAAATRALELGEVQFVLHLPAGFERDLVRGRRPVVLLEADASDPAATSNAISALQTLAARALEHDLLGPLARPAMEGAAPFDLRIHRRYNPEGITQYNIVPGLMGVVLTMTMVIITALAITRERERGTMENLLSTPVHPLEVMLGKLVPYVLLGYIQVTLILCAAKFLFRVPVMGSVPLLLASVLVFIVANLSVGILFSTIAKNQLQAMQMAFFFFLPSILLSGFMFPFRGMPQWAQWLGEVLPLTHFLRVVRGILLKGNGPAEVVHHLWPIALFVVVVVSLGLKRYRRTLD